MFRKPATTQTASINSRNQVVVMCSDGFEDIIDYTASFDNETAAKAHLAANGFVAYDPNAGLKAQGLVFINGCYQRAGA